MTEWDYLTFEGMLRKPDPGWGKLPVFLVFGDDLLCDKIVAGLLTVLLSGASSVHGVDVVEGRNENLTDALARLNTFSLLAPGKVVHFKDARLFYGKGQQGDLLQKARQAAGGNRLPQAARILCDLFGLLGCRLEDFQDPDAAGGLLPGFDPKRDREWFDRTLALAAESGLSPGPSGDVQKLLEAAVEAGFPKGHHLIVTTDHVDRRRGLFKLLVDRGAVIDCTLSSADRSSGPSASDVVIRSLLARRLAECGKQMDPEAIARLVEKTGEDLRLITGNLDRLIDFAGDRSRISTADVEALLPRTRQDPLYAFTDAVTDRDLARALFFLGSLMGSGQFDHPLPLLAAVVNQVRKLLAVKDFLQSPMGRAWKPGMPYGAFQKQVLPVVQEHDRALSTRRQEWLAAVSETPGDGGRGGQKKPPASDLLLAPSAKSPFPLYKLFLKSERFSPEALLEALEILGEADLRLKRSGTDGRLVLESVLFRICETPEDRVPRPGGGGRRGK